MQRGDGPHDGDGGRARVLLAERRQRRAQHALVGQRPALDDRRRLAAVAAVGDELLGDARELAHAHVEDERAREGRQRRPVDGGLRLLGVLVAGHEGHRAGHPALGDRDPGIGRRGHAGGHAGNDLVVAARPRAAPAPPRRRARRRTGRRPSGGRRCARRGRARPAAAWSRAGAPARRRPPCPTSTTSASARAWASASGGIRRSWRMTSARAMSSSARAVSRPGSPGPAPTRYAVTAPGPRARRRSAAARPRRRPAARAPRRRARRAPRRCRRAPRRRRAA